MTKLYWKARCAATTCRQHCDQDDPNERIVCILERQICRETAYMWVFAILAVLSALSSISLIFF